MIGTSARKIITGKDPISVEEWKFLKPLFRNGVLTEINKKIIEERAGGEPLIVVQCPDSHRFGEHHEHTKDCCEYPHPLTSHGGMLSFVGGSPLLELYRKKLGSMTEAIPLHNRADVTLACKVKTNARSSVLSIHFPCAASRNSGMTPLQAFQVFATSIVQQKNDFKNDFNGHKGQELAKGVIPVVFICRDVEEEMFFFDKGEWESYCKTQGFEPYWK